MNNNNSGGSEDQGFASMDSEEQSKIVKKGGEAVHRKGTAQEFTSGEDGAKSRGEQSSDTE